MIYAGELKPFFASGRIVPRAMLGAILEAEKGIDLFGPLEARDAAIRERWNEEVSAKLVGRRITDYIEDDPIEWHDSDDPQEVGAGFFFFADDLDWESGRLVAEILDPNLGDSNRESDFATRSNVASSRPTAPFKKSRYSVLQRSFAALIFFISRVPFSKHN
jgi:hypothetical protein